jgi:hypothetical protein
MLRGWKRDFGAIQTDSNRLFRREVNRACDRVRLAAGPGDQSVREAAQDSYDPKIDPEVQIGTQKIDSASAEPGMPEPMKRELDEALTEQMRQGLTEQFSRSAPAGAFRSPTRDESEDSKS